MSSTTALNSALSGLRLAQQGLDVTALNVANAQTDGYTRKVLPQESVLIGNTGVGVRSGEIQRYVDQRLLRDYRMQIGVEAGLSVRESYLSRIQSFHGSSDQETNIVSSLNKLYSSFVTLSATPESTTARQVVVDQASALAASFNKYGNFLAELRSDAQHAIANEVASMNGTLKTIADFNVRIQQLKFLGQSSAAVEDQRDLALKKLSESIDLSYFEDGDGMLVVQTKSGQVLADSTARPLVFNNEGMTYAASYPESLSGVMLKDVSGSFDLATTQLGGRLGGLLTLRDRDLPSYMGQLDELAHKIASRLDAQGMRLFTNTDGSVPANAANQYVGFSQTIRVNSIIVTDPTYVQSGTTGPSLDPGSSAMIDKVVNYAFGRSADASGTPHPAFALSGNGPGGLSSFIGLVGNNASLDEFARAMLGRQAEEHAIVSSQLTTEKTYTQEVQKRLLDDSGVNTDEEMARLIELQKNYTASAKIINALDELFKQLMSAL